jgi:hypothetical protein
VAEWSKTLWAFGECHINCGGEVMSSNSRVRAWWLWAFGSSPTLSITQIGAVRKKHSVAVHLALGKVLFLNRHTSVPVSVRDL